MRERVGCFFFTDTLSLDDTVNAKTKAHRLFFRYTTLYQQVSVYKCVHARLFPPYSRARAEPVRLEWRSLLLRPHAFLHPAGKTRLSTLFLTKLNTNLQL